MEFSSFTEISWKFSLPLRGRNVATTQSHRFAKFWQKTRRKLPNFHRIHYHGAFNFSTFWISSRYILWKFSLSFLSFLYISISRRSFARVIEKERKNYVISDKDRIGFAAILPVNFQAPRDESNYGGDGAAAGYQAQTQFIPLVGGTHSLSLSLSLSFSRIFLFCFSLTLLYLVFLTPASFSLVSLPLFRFLVSLLSFSCIFLSRIYTSLFLPLVSFLSLSCIFRSCLFFSLCLFVSRVSLSVSLLASQRPALPGWPGHSHYTRPPRRKFHSPVQADAWSPARSRFAMTHRAIMRRRNLPRIFG